MEPFDEVERIYRLLKRPFEEVTFIVPSDLTPFLQRLLAVHPGLDFLKQTPEFQEKYVS